MQDMSSISRTGRGCTTSLRALLVVALLLGTGCSTNVATGRSQLILLSPDQTRAMGEEAKPQMIAEMGGEASSKELRAYVRSVGETLVRQVEPEYADIQWEFFCVESDMINAFALPGGKVFITKGLMSAFENEAQVAGVLGHEIGHVTARHVDERLSQTITAELGLAVLGQYSGSELITLGASLATDVTLLKFNRDQERESDRLGVRYMSQAGYDPYGMVEVLEVLAEAASSGSPPELLSTHPHPESRLVEVKELLAGPYVTTQHNPAYQKYADRFQKDAKPYLK